MLIIAFISIIVLVLADQLIKIWCVDNLLYGQSIDFIKIGDFKIFDLTLHENIGALFGSMAGKRWFLIAVTSLTILVCLYLLIKTGKKSKFFVSSMTLIISGGVGNLIDRIFNDGKVVDMFDFQIFDFAIFNFADTCVVIGSILLFIYILFIEPKVEKNSKEALKESKSE